MCTGGNGVQLRITVVNGDRGEQCPIGVGHSVPLCASALTNHNNRYLIMNFSRHTGHKNSTEQRQSKSNKCSTAANTSNYVTQ